MYLSSDNGKNKIRVFEVKNKSGRKD
jgi:hypothetical protein